MRARAGPQRKDGWVCRITQVVASGRTASSRLFGGGLPFLRGRVELPCRQPAFARAPQMKLALQLLCDVAHVSGAKEDGDLLIAGGSLFGELFEHDFVPL